MTLVDRLRAWLDSSEKFRAVSGMPMLDSEFTRLVRDAIARIEAADVLELATDSDTMCSWHVEPINASGLCALCDYRALVREQDA